MFISQPSRLAIIIEILCHSLVSFPSPGNTNMKPSIYKVEIVSAQVNQVFQHKSPLFLLVRHNPGPKFLVELVRVPPSYLVRRALFSSLMGSIKLPRASGLGNLTRRAPPSPLFWSTPPLHPFHLLLLMKGNSALLTLDGYQRSRTRLDLK